ncbi:hypothetical protein K1719_038361 [Acacia pycnantha]|nr:hypothetical protein K1719_038361 [Acacia pycnantha]
METVMRNFQKIWGHRGCSRQHHSKEELYDGYTLLRNHNMTVMMPEKQSKKKMKQSRVAPRTRLPQRLRGTGEAEIRDQDRACENPRFMALLKDAENENGNSVQNDGPIYLPCDVDVFHEALAEIMTTNFESSFSDSSMSFNPRSAKHNWAR